MGNLVSDRRGAASNVWEAVKLQLSRKICLVGGDQDKRLAARKGKNTKKHNWLNIWGKWCIQWPVCLSRRLRFVCKVTNVSKMTSNSSKQCCTVCTYNVCRFLFPVLSQNVCGTMRTMFVWQHKMFPDSFKKELRNVERYSSGWLEEIDLYCPSLTDAHCRIDLDCWVQIE